LKPGLNPGELAIEASKHEKLIIAYAIKKKLEIIGAIMSREPVNQINKNFLLACKKGVFLLCM
jgi:hypothetical protein